MQKVFLNRILSLPVFLGMILTFVITLGVVTVGFRYGWFDDKINNKPATESTVEKNSDSISIPGYEMLELKADTREQTLCMPNPPQNFCYFQLSLYLPDGTLIWQSELIEPGSTSKPMVLLYPLSKGVYANAILKYSCYSMDETLTPLNDAETKLTLRVK